MAIPSAPPTTPTREPGEHAVPARPWRLSRTSLELEFERPGLVCHFVLIAPSPDGAGVVLMRMVVSRETPWPLCGRRDGCAVDPRWLSDWRADVCELCSRKICRECQERYGT